MYSNGLNLNASSYQSVYASTGSSLAVPVKPSSLIYAHFDNVHGVAASRGQQGVSVNKLRILNTLIDQLKTMKTGNPISENFTDTLSSSQQDQLIEKYNRQINDSIKNPAYSYAGQLPETGSLVSISL